MWKVLATLMLLVTVSADNNEKRLTHLTAKTKLKRAQIDTYPDKKCVVEGKYGKVSLQTIKETCIDAVIEIKEKMESKHKKRLCVVGGTELDHDGVGLYKHSNGYRIDVYRIPPVTMYIVNNMMRVKDPLTNGTTHFIDKATGFRYDWKDDRWIITCHNFIPPSATVKTTIR